MGVFLSAVIIYCNSKCKNCVCYLLNVVTKYLRVNVDDRALLPITVIWIYKIIISARTFLHVVRTNFDIYVIADHN